MGQPACILQRGQRPDLRHAVHAEMVADLFKLGNQRGRTHRIADPCARHSIGLGEGPHPDDARIVNVDRGGGRGKFYISLIQDQHRAVGQRIQRRCQGGAVMPCSHRIVGVRQIDQPGPYLGRANHQGGGVLMIVAVGHLVQHAAIAGDVIIESRIGSIGGDHRIARRDHQPHEIAQQPVYAFTHHDIFRRNTILRGQRLAQIVARGIRVFPDLDRRVAHCLNCAGRRAEDAFIGAQPRIKGRAANPLQCLRANKGDCVGQRPDEWGDAYI